MATISRELLDDYSRAVDSAMGAASDDVRRLLEAYRELRPDATIEEIRDMATGALEVVCQTYGDAAAVAANEFSEATLGQVGISVIDNGVDYPVQRASMGATARYQVGKVIDGDWPGFVRQMCRAAANYVGQAANSQTMANVRRHASDPKSYAAANGKRAPRTRWARVPTSLEPCTFCMMLASRGFVYWSKESADSQGHFHNGCKCKVVEGVDGLDVEGYDPDGLYDYWRAFKEIDEDRSMSVKERTAAKMALLEGEGGVGHYEREIAAGTTHANRKNPYQ